MAFVRTKRKGSVAAISPRRGSANWARSAVDGYDPWIIAAATILAPSRKGQWSAGEGRRRDERVAARVGQEFGGGLEMKIIVLVPQ